ncbi:MAG: aldehyde dehydrogenase (NADP(+)) [Candidatus Rifleibacteriota bacterium]
MIHNPVLVNGDWREANFPVSSFKAVNPNTGKQLKDSFPVSSFLDIDEMLQNHASSLDQIEAITPEKRSEFLLLIANELLSKQKDLIETAFEETGLDKKHVLTDSEFMQTLARLKEAASFCLNRTWSDISIDRQNNIRSRRKALSGPVAIFGPSSSPFLYNSCVGINFSAAIAAGNAVMAKGNPNHPMTSLKLAQIVDSARKKLNLPAVLFQYFHHTTHDLGYRLAAHPLLGAFSFTGSFRCGIALKENVDRSGNPGFFEMGTASPVFLLPDAVAERKVDLGHELTRAALTRNGQSCLKPGIAFLVENKDSSQLIKSTVELFSNNPTQPMLTDVLARNLDTQIANFIRMGARKLTKREFYAPNPFVFPNTVLLIDAKSFFKHPRLFQEELFGPVLVFVTLEKKEDFARIAHNLDGCIAASIFHNEAGDENQYYRQLKKEIARKSGRIVINRFANQSALSNAMAQSGPFPASGTPTFSSTYFPDAIRRFTALECYENAEQCFLPQDLRDTPPGNGTMRMIDGLLSSD